MRYVFGCWVDGQDVIEMPVVESSVNFFFYMLEIAYHAVGIELSCGAVHGNNPVVTMCIRAFALGIKGSCQCRSQNIGL